MHICRTLTGLKYILFLYTFTSDLRVPTEYSVRGSISHFHRMKLVCWQNGQKKVYCTPHIKTEKSHTNPTLLPTPNDTKPHSCSVPFQTALEAVWKHLCQKGLWGWREKQVLGIPGKGQQPSASKEENTAQLWMLCCKGGETIWLWEEHSTFTWVTYTTVYKNCHVRIFEAFYQPSS